MFNALESNWEQCARRGWTTFASFAVQVFGLSLLLAIPIAWVQGPPQLEWLQPLTLPATVTPAAPTQVAHGHATVSASNLRAEEVTAPPAIPSYTTNDSAKPVPAAPDWNSIGSGSFGGARDGSLGSMGGNMPVVVPSVVPPKPPVSKPLMVSHWAEGNLIYRVQPIYPALARQARIQGTVELRAMIGKTGTIENLVVVRGHPMLSGAAVEAVRQWRYRPYLLNDEPIEVETEITVNFLLSGD
jgi:periplasmic protein TonB